jgi:hypothetical protein
MVCVDFDCRRQHRPKILNNLHNLLNQLFSVIACMEVLVLRRHILHPVHDGKPLNPGYGRLVEGESVAGL